MDSPSYGISPTAESLRNLARDRPCDACRRCKSRCVRNDGQVTCVLCQLHSRDCTFLREPATRKRKSAGEHVAESSAKRIVKRETSIGFEEYDDLKVPSLLKKTLGLRHKVHAQVVGATSGLETSLLGDLPFGREELPLSHGALRRASTEHVFLLLPDKDTQTYQEEVRNLNEVQAIVAPYGKALVALYFRIVHPSWPILHKGVFLEKYARSYREFSSPLLAAVYLLSLQYWSYDDSLSNHTKPDVQKLARLATKTLADTLHRPKLSTIQAGLLLLQHTQSDPAEATPQLINIGYSLGLHLDASDWMIPDWEKGLRNRLGWALYLQDKFSCLGTGRPPLMASANWGLRPLTSSEFPENAADEDDRDGSSEVEQGRILFSQMIVLTEILTDLLESMFSVRAARQISQAGDGALSIVLEKAKPIQLRLRDWYARLPDCLSMDSTNILKLSSVGHLRLAYLATEITLHRRIIQVLSSNTPPALFQICRSAARERFTSAVDFVNALKPQHLQSFWYFASAQHFALIGTFGCLLYGTSKGTEGDFYKVKLREYRWMLKINNEHGCRFMKPALGIMDANLMFMTLSGKPEADTPSTGQASVSPVVERQAFMDPHVRDTHSVSSPADLGMHSFENFENFQYDHEDSTPGMFNQDLSADFFPPMGFQYDFTG